MARVKGAMHAKAKHNRVLKLAKGYRGARSKQYRVAKQTVMRALATAYEGRKQRKRQFRTLWIARINAACRMNDISYSRFMFGLKKARSTRRATGPASLFIRDIGLKCWTASSPTSTCRNLRLSCWSAPWQDGSMCWRPTKRRSKQNTVSSALEMRCLSSKKVPFTPAGIDHAGGHIIR